MASWIVSTIVRALKVPIKIDNTVQRQSLTPLKCLDMVLLLLAKTYQNVNPDLSDANDTEFSELTRARKVFFP